MLHLQLAEVIPAAPALPAAGAGLAGIFTAVLWVIAIGLLLVWRRTVGALFEHLADIMDRVQVHVGPVRVRPLAPFSATLRGADWLVQQGLSAAVHGSESATVYLFHQSAALFTLTGHMIRGLAHDTLLAFHWIEHHRIPRAIALALIPPLAAIVGIRALVHVLRAELRNNAARFRSQVHRLTHATTVALPRDIARVRSRVGRLEHDLEAESARVKQLAALVSLAGFSAFMWRWMGKYGLRWLRCPSLARIGSRIGCGGFGFLEELLALSFTALAFSDLCSFAGAMTRLAEWYRPLLMDFVDVEDALIGCHGATKPEPLGLPRLYLPPVPNPLPLD